MRASVGFTLERAELMVTDIYIYIFKEIKIIFNFKKLKITSKKCVSH
jgi:hypothetical protein